MRDEKDGACDFVKCSGRSKRHARNVWRREAMAGQRVGLLAAQQLQRGLTPRIFLWYLLFTRVAEHWPPAMDLSRGEARLQADSPRPSFLADTPSPPGSHARSVRRRYSRLTLRSTRRAHRLCAALRASARATARETRTPRGLHCKRRSASSVKQSQSSLSIRGDSARSPTLGRGVGAW